MTIVRAIPVYKSLDPEAEKNLCHEHRMTDPDKLKDAADLLKQPVNIPIIYEEAKRNNDTTF